MGGSIVQNVANQFGDGCRQQGYVDSKINNLTGSLNQALKNIDQNTQGSLLPWLERNELVNGQARSIGGNVVSITVNSCRIPGCVRVH